MQGRIYLENIQKLPSAPVVRELLPVICEAVTKAVPEIRKIYLYGSQARGDWTEDSDADLFVVVRESPEKDSLLSRLDHAICEAAYDCEEIYPPFFPFCSYKDLDKFTERDFREGLNPAFVENLKREGVILYGE